jgi:hypothetical protein
MKSKQPHPVFAEGDEVTWTSQSQGFEKKKCGKIVRVIPKGTNPAVPQGMRVQGVGLGGARNHQSYLVGIGNVLYWPRVTLLRPDLGSKKPAE